MSSSSSSSTPITDIGSMDTCCVACCNSLTDAIWQIFDTSDPQGCKVFASTISGAGASAGGGGSVGALSTGGGASAGASASSGGSGGPGGGPIPVNPATGGYVGTEFDFGNGGSMPGLGKMLMLPSRDMSNLQVYNGPSGAAGNTGNNWFNSLTPSLVLRTDGLLAYTGLPRRQIYFEETDPGEYTALFYSQSQLTRDDTPGASTFTVTGPSGTRVVFDNDEGEPGALLRIIKPDGAELLYSPDAAGRVESITRVMDDGADSVNGLYFDYVYPPSFASSEPTENTSMIASITVKYAGAPLRRVRYDYYLEDETDFGLAGDLRLAIQEIYNEANSEWEETGRTYYRYYTETSSEDHGVVHCIKYLVNSEGWRRMVAAGINPLTADAETELAPYAATYLEYETSKRRITKLVQDGIYMHEFEYATQPPAGAQFSPEDMNRWTLECTQKLPDGNTAVYYANQYGAPLAKVFQETATGDKWCWFVQRDSLGQVFKYAMPSAVVSISSTNNPVATLKADAGLVTWYEYDTTHNLVLIQDSKGDGGSEDPTKITQRIFEFGTSGTVDGVEISVPTVSTINQSLVGAPSTTTYAYVWYSGFFQVAKRTTTLPVIISGQNGDGQTYTQQELFDINGNRTWLRDERGVLTAFFHDPVTFAMVRRIDDVDTTILAPPDQTPPWTTPVGDQFGNHLVTDYENDSEGRNVQVLGPWHEIDRDGVATMIRRASWTLRMDAAHEVRQSRGYITGQNTTPGVFVMNPVQITKLDAIHRVIDEVVAVRGGDGDASPLETAGRVTDVEVFPQPTWTRWKSRQFDTAGTLLSERLYHAIPEFGTGQPVVNYAQTDFAYDDMGHTRIDTAPGGTITLRTYTAMGWLSETMVGTVNGGTGDNMRVISTRIYDYGADGGNGTLTQLVAYYGPGGSARVTNYVYDYRNLRTKTAVIGAPFYDTITYDNADRVFANERYATTGDGLLARQYTGHDNQGRVYRRTQYAVEGEMVGNPVSEDIWYDPAGNTIKHRPLTGRAFTKMSYDGVGRMIAQYLAVNEAGTDSPSSVAADIVAEQTTLTYDAGSNVIFTTPKQRFHDAAVDAAGKGPLGDVDIEPLARVSFATAYPDGIGRTVATANYGTHGSTVPVRPALIPESTDTCLVSLTHYGASGEVEESVDANGIVTRQEYDNAGRLVKSIENSEESPNTEQ